eukprot:scaffold156423_cov26-Tisochrysis_lutea.AAC.1
MCARLVTIWVFKFRRPRGVPGDHLVRCVCGSFASVSLLLGPWSLAPPDRVHVREPVVVDRLRLGDGIRAQRGR